MWLLVAEGPEGRLRVRIERGIVTLIIQLWRLHVHQVLLLRHLALLLGLPRQPLNLLRGLRHREGVVVVRCLATKQLILHYARKALRLIQLAR